MTVGTVDDLVGRSNRLGADPANTNYAGGNTSAKGVAVDPVTGAEVDLLWVKGSGGDLGTLTPAGLAVLRLDRLRSLVGVYPGVEREDEMVAAFDHCLPVVAGPVEATAMGNTLVQARALGATGGTLADLRRLPAGNPAAAPLRTPARRGVLACRRRPAQREPSLTRTGVRRRSRC
jgi:hypothetical protein